VRVNRSTFVLQRYDGCNNWDFIKGFDSRTNLVEALEIAEKEDPNRIYRGVVKVSETIYTENFQEKNKRLKLNKRRTYAKGA